MLHLHIDIEHDDAHSVESVALAKALLKTQYELLHHKVAMHQLFKVVAAIRPQHNLDRTLAHVPSNLGLAPISVIEALREFAATNLPAFKMQLSERP